MTTHSVLLVEDDVETRARLVRAVGSHTQLAVLADVGGCAEARAALAAYKPDVLLIDLGLPDGSGIDIIRETRRSHPATEIMVITVFGDERHVVAAIEAGASGYLLKDAAADFVGSAILQMLSGGSPISAAIARHLLKRFQPSPPADSVSGLLTVREREVLDLVAKGFAYTEIGEVLGMSVHTVTSHIKHIYRKLEVRSRGEAVFEAQQRGLLKPPG